MLGIHKAAGSPQISALHADKYPALLIARRRTNQNTTAAEIDCLRAVFESGIQNQSSRVVVAGNSMPTVFCTTRLRAVNSSATDPFYGACRIWIHLSYLSENLHMRPYRSISTRARTPHRSVVEAQWVPCPFSIHLAVAMWQPPTRTGRVG